MICVKSVNVSPASVTLEAESWYYNARAEVCPLNAECREVEWYSSDTSIATVNSLSGYIYAKKAGTTRIYAEATDGSGVRDYITVVVKSKICVDSVEISPSRISIEEGECYNLSVTVCPTNATSKSLSWTSSNTNVATVNNGKVCGISKGTALIKATATDGSGEYGCCTVTVTGDVLVTSITVNPSTKTLQMGKAAFLHATVCPSNATKPYVEWTSSNPGIVYVNPTDGLIYGQNSGTATVYATATDGSGKRGSCVVTVPCFVPALAVKICAQKDTMIIGEMQDLNKTVCPTNATDQTVYWTSSNPNVATVTAQTGHVVALAEGETTITATTANGNASAEIIITVEKPSVTIQKNGLVNEIIFDQTGEKWICIENEYVFFDTTGASESELQQHNTLGEYCLDNLYDAEALKITREEMNGLVLPSKEHLRTYEEDALRLLYSLDPHGVAAYVKLYAEHNYSTLEEKVAYKDNMFKIIFNRNPRHYTRRQDNGYWYVDLDWENMNIKAVLSESDFVFGTRMIWDSSVAIMTINSLIQSAKDFVLGLAHIDKILFFVDFIKDVAVRNNVSTSLSQELLNSLLGEMQRKVTKTILRVFNVAALAGYAAYEEAMRLPDYEKSVYMYCIENSKYNIYIKNDYGDIARLDSIRGALE